MFRVLVQFLFYVLILWLPQARCDDTYPTITVLKGKASLSTGAMSFLASEITIQTSKIENILGLKLNPSSALLAVRVLNPEELFSISGLESANAVTIDGVMNFSFEDLNSEVIRHEVFHAMVFKLVGDKLPWWVEEGLAQILSGEFDKGRTRKAKTKAERKYHEARLRVSRLINKCSFRAFGTYVRLIEEGNTERYAFNKIFNDECTNEKR